MKLLFVDCCISQRGTGSRTRALAEAYLEAFRTSHPEAEIETVQPETLLALKPFDVEMLNDRDALAAVGAWDAPVFALARQFRGADRIVVAAPFWSTIDHLPDEERRKMTLLRKRFPSMLITGPFSILVGFSGGMMALNDRLKLRSMVVAETEDIAYVASEECAIRRIAPDVTDVWAPRGGQPVIFTREGGHA